MYKHCSGTGRGHNDLKTTMKIQNYLENCIYLLFFALQVSLACACAQVKTQRRYVFQPKCIINFASYQYHSFLPACHV